MDAQSVADLLDRDGPAGRHVDQGDDVRYDGQRGAVLQGGDEFAAALDEHQPARVGAAALQQDAGGVVAVGALGGVPPYGGDLAGQQRRGSFAAAEGQGAGDRSGDGVPGRLSGGQG